MSNPFVRRLLGLIGKITTRRAPAASWTKAHPPQNLLVQLTPLIGRDHDIAAIRKRLIAGGTRLITLVGPPGVGKTRLALAVAEDVLEQFQNGASFVRLNADRNNTGLTGITNPVYTPVGHIRSLLARQKESWEDRPVCHPHFPVWTPISKAISGPTSTSRWPASSSAN